MSLLEHLRSSSRTTTSAPAPPPISPPAAPLPAIEPLVASSPSPPIETAPRGRGPVRNEVLVELKARVHEDLIHELDPEQLLGDTSFNSPARKAVEQAAEERISEVDATLGRQERLPLAS